MNDPTATAPVVSTIIGTSTSVAVGFSSITTTRRSMNKSTMESTGKTVNTRSNNNSNKNHSKLAAVELITDEQTNIPYKLNPVSTSRDFYREPVLTRVAADLRNSPIASDSLSVLHTTDHLVVASDPTDSKLKRKYPDILTTSPSSSSPIQYQTVIISDNSGSSSSISSIGSSKEKRKKKSSRKHSSSLVSMNEDDIIATVVSDNNDSDAINKNSNNAGNTELPHYPSIEVKSNPFSLSNGLQSIMHTVPSTSNTNNIVQMAFNDFRSLLYDALHKLEEKCDILAESTSDNDINLGSAPRLPHLHRICSDVAVQTEDDNAPYQNIDLDSSSSSLSCVDNSLKACKSAECKTVQTDVVPTSSPSKFGHRPPTFQERLMEAEIWRMEKENQRLNVLLAYTRAEMALEMNRRISELRKIWSYELKAVVESAGKMWEQDVVQIVDAVKRCQWCAYCGRVAYYYCCWNTSYCNGVCQAKHWAVHMNSCVQIRIQVNNKSSNCKTTSSGPGTRYYDPLTSLNSSTTTTDQCLQCSVQPSTQMQRHHPYNWDHHHQNQ